MFFTLLIPLCGVSSADPTPPDLSVMSLIICDLEFPHVVLDPIFHPYRVSAWHLHVHDCLDLTFFILHSIDMAIPEQSDLSGIFLDVIYSQLFPDICTSYLTSSGDFFILSICISVVSKICSSFVIYRGQQIAL